MKKVEKKLAEMKMKRVLVAPSDFDALKRLSAALDLPVPVVVNDLVNIGLKTYRNHLKNVQKNGQTYFLDKKPKC